MRIIEVHVAKSALEPLDELSKKHGAIETWHVATGRDMVIYSVLVRAHASQALIDAMQTMTLDTRPTRLILRPVEATLPRVEEEKKEENEEEDDGPKKKTFSGISREELYNSLARGAVLDSNFLLLVVLATIVAAIGLVQDNAAVVIGAMVIAPLLGPNLALALATAIADADLMARSIRTNLIGTVISLALATAIGLLWPINISSHELMSRTFVGFDSVVLALASGAAAVLSLTTGVSSVLVGVMVAVALLPPAAAFGLLLGTGYVQGALGAGLMLAVNIVCINLSAKLVFQFKGVRPHLWYKKQKAKAAMRRSLTIWLVTLLVLAVLIYLYQRYYQG